MDLQSAFNIVAGVACGIGGWVLRIIWDAQQRLSGDLAELERRLPDTYARRDDIRDLRRELNERFDRLEVLMRGEK
jgi:hypothetical protein